jgi:hypothetical protein
VHVSSFKDGAQNYFWYELLNLIDVWFSLAGCLILSFSECCFKWCGFDTDYLPQLRGLTLDFCLS